jgi:hypothetical protein
MPHTVKLYAGAVSISVYEQRMENGALSVEMEMENGAVMSVQLADAVV